MSVAGVKLAPVGTPCITFKSNVEFWIVISVGIFLTVTLIVLLSGAASYLSLPLNETVMVASPSLTAIISPSMTVAILELLEV